MDIVNRKLNVEDAFLQNFYVVPDYQREYVWTRDNVNQLFEDINDEFQNKPDSEYFIGSIVVCKTGNKKFEVIDGQQRLTTLFLCLCAFKKLLKEDKVQFEHIKKKLFDTRSNDLGEILSSYKLILQYEGSSEIIQDISEEKDIQEELNGSSKNIYEAYDYLINYLKNNFKEKGELKKFLGYINNKVNFIQIETPSISDALKIFETINARGVGLNPMDLLKNLIFRQVEKKEFDKLKKEWKKITDTLEKNKQKPLRFLRYFIMANYNVKNSKGEAIVREDEIYNWITNKKNIEQCDYENKPFEFVKKIQDNVEAYAKFSKGLDQNGERDIYLDNIKKLSGSFSQHLVLFLAAKDLNKEIFDHLAKQIEVLIFYYILTRTQTKELERKLSKWAKELVSISKFSGNDQKKGLNNFIETIITPEIKSKENELKSSFMEFNYNSLQQYRLKYILAKITQYIELQRLGQKNPELLDEYVKTKIEIEHILPNNPEQELKETFGEGYEEYKLKLGNLTLLEKPINVVAGRDFFEGKKKLYPTSKFLLTRSITKKETIGQNSSINRINEQLKSFEKWDKDSINERQEMLFELAKKIWVIENIQ